MLRRATNPLCTVSRSACNSQKLAYSASPRHQQQQNQQSHIRSPSVQLPQVSELQSALKISWQDGGTSIFHNIWLRDHCPSNYHEITKQRMMDTVSIPASIHPESFSTSPDGLHIKWNSSTSAEESKFSWDWLKEHTYYSSNANTNSASRSTPIPKLKLWLKEDIEKSLPTVEYDLVMKSDEGVLKWLQNINDYGFSFVDGVPATPKNTEELIKRIAFIRPTHYGGFWDFTADMAHGDTAYSEVPLRAHTDNTYFSDPAGLQLFHLLSPRSTHSGGHSLLVDGFRAASELYYNYPSYYRLLSTLPIPTHASGGDDTNFKPSINKPALEHDPDTGILRTVRWNGDDRDVIGGNDSMAWKGEWENSGKHKVEAFYEALKVWEGLLRSNEAEYWTALEPGRALLFDNHRVLHGRSGFSGKRRLCGAYVNGDDWRSRQRTLQNKEYE